MKFKSFAKRSSIKRSCDDAGITLLETVVSSVIMGLVSIMILNIFQTTNQTAATVQTSTATIASSQLATQKLSKDIRNASKLKVTSDGTRLDVETDAGVCKSWVFYSNSLYSHSGTNKLAFDAAVWFKQIPDSTLMGGKKFFTPITNGARYAFNLGSGAGAVALEGESTARLLAKEKDSKCFSDGVGETGVNPSPTAPAMINYEIIYTLNGGTASNPTSYNKDTAAFTLNNPTRSGFIFDGWTGTDITGKAMTVTIASGSTGTKSYAASWKAEPETPVDSNGDLSATIKQDNGWGNTYQYTVIVKNNGSKAVNGWSVSWKAPGLSSVVGWNAVCSKSDSTITCVNQSYNSSIPAGGEQRFSGQVDGSGSVMPKDLVITAKVR